MTNFEILTTLVIASYLTHQAHPEYPTTIEDTLIAYHDSGNLALFTRENGTRDRVAAIPFHNARKVLETVITSHDYGKTYKGMIERSNSMLKDGIVEALKAYYG